MNLKTLGLASTVILFFSSPMPSLCQTQPTSETKSPQQSKLVPHPIPLEIKGGRIGETIAQFAAHHPNAKCEDQTPVVKLCSQTQNVSLAELTTESAACSPPETGTFWETFCTLQGVHATFYMGQLRIITYTFVGDFSRNVCDAFVTKYGKPRGRLKGGCTWWRDQDNVILGAWTLPKKEIGADFDTTEVELWDNNASKDI